eukprot:2124485-Rhodomonas_salina.1
MLYAAALMSERWRCCWSRRSCCTSGTEAVVTVFGTSGTDVFCTALCTGGTDVLVLRRGTSLRAR